jgi:histidinol-phosphate aminotransferase
MAGFRIGTLVGDAAHIKMVLRVSSPYNVNAVALSCLPMALADDKYIQHYVDQVREGRTRLQDDLRNRAIPFWPSEANFVVARFGQLKSAFVESMRACGILVRDRSRDYGCDGCVRITIGTIEHTNRLLVALRKVLEEIGTTEARAQ